ncbi:MAG: inositol monophosphatase [Nocardioides sp.]|nr:inositol monophosphatase [Nocardioides sp.]
MSDPSGGPFPVVADPVLAAGLADVAVAVAEEAAALVRQARRGHVEVAASKTSEVDVVTETDRASEQLVRARLAVLRPDDAVLGEEGDDVAGTTGVRWVVDPVDGTVNFLYDLPQYAVSVAAEVDGETVAGVVVDVAAGTSYVARVADDGSGRVVALRDGVPLRVRPGVPLGQRLVGTGFSYDAAVREQQARSLVHLLPRVRDVRRMGACALDLCHVAGGSLDGYVEEGTHLWDHAAGALLVRAAGGRVLRGPGASGRDLLLAGPDDGFDDLERLTRDAGYWAATDH